MRTSRCSLEHSQTRRTGQPFVSAMRRLGLSLVWLCSAPLAATAQGTIPVRQVQVVATSSSDLRSVFGMKSLANGGVLVNDPMGRRLIAFDSTLTRARVVLDSTTSAADSYGQGPSIIMPYLGDSVVFLDSQAQAFVLLDPLGRRVRTMAAPPFARELKTAMATLNVANGFDPAGRLVYAGLPPSPVIHNARDADKSEVVQVLHDSISVFRYTLGTGAKERLGSVGRPVLKVYQTFKNGEFVGSGNYLNPLPEMDEWALLPNGTVAFVRGHDYHIDWIRPDGSKESTPKMPFDWRKITLEDKQRMLDSIKNAWDTMTLPAGRKLPPGRVVDVTDLPDYNPPIRQGQVFADCDGNVWILPTTSYAAGDGLVYDVVDGKGRLFQRVRVPSGRVVAGFGPHGIVYLVSTIANMRRIERAKLTR